MEVYGGKFILVDLQLVSNGNTETKKQRQENKDAETMKGLDNLDSVQISKDELQKMPRLELDVEESVPVPIETSQHESSMASGVHFNQGGDLAMEII